MGVIFFAGTYGVGKSTLCEKLSKHTGIPFYSASDLISEVNGELYGANKAVVDKNRNQQILVKRVDELLIHQSQIILAGHFSIFDSYNSIELLPEEVFLNLHIESVLLLQTDINTIHSNLQKRDRKEYPKSALLSLQIAEEDYARSITGKLQCPLIIHNMTFDNEDVIKCIKALERKELRNESTT